MNVQKIRRDEGKIIDVLGMQMEWKVTEAETGGHYCLFDMLVPPGAGVPLHQHEPQETFVVLEGEAEFGRMGPNGEEWLKALPGDAVNIPSWTMHGFRNTSGSVVRILLTCNAGMEAFFREAGVPVAQGGSLPVGPPSPTEIERVIGIAIRRGQRFMAPAA
jgi:quercetin dioxygenase-like cupin family protein